MNEGDQARGPVEKSSPPEGVNMGSWQPIGAYHACMTLEGHTISDGRLPSVAEDSSIAAHCTPREQSAALNWGSYNLHSFP